MSSNVVDRTIGRVSAKFGNHSKEVERFIKFSIVGTLGAVVDFTTLNILQSTALPPINPHQNIKIAISTGIAFCAAVLSNFLWNRYWTYPDSRTRSFRRQLVIFYGINAAALFFRLLFVGVSFHFFANLSRSLFTDLRLEQSFQAGTNIAQGIAVIIAMFWNFGINRMWTYNDVGHEG